MLELSTWLILFLFTLLYLRVYKDLYPDFFPPGPRNVLLYFGDILFHIGKDYAKGFGDLHAKYGPVVGLNFLGFKMVSIGDINVLKETFSKEEFSAKPIQEGLNSLRQGNVKDGSNPGLLGSDGETWRENRTFTLRSLKYLGLGKPIAEKIIIDESSRLVDDIVNRESNVIPINDVFNIFILNSIWRLISSKRIDNKDEEIRETFKYLDKFAEDAGTSSALMAFSSSILMNIFEATGLVNISIGFNRVMSIVDREISDHERTFEKGNIRDFIDCFIDEKLSMKSDQETLRCGHQNLRNIALDLFLAGSETTATTLKWAVLFMILHQDVQAKVQDEIDRVMVDESMSVKELKSQMPYTLAVLHEVQRRGNIAPVGVIHRTTSETRVGSYVIPGNTLVVPNLTSILHDPVVFPDPMKFDPERFLSADGMFEPHPNNIPFGVGKHRCIGEKLADVELFVFYTTLLKNFTIFPETESELPSTHYRPGITLAPNPFKGKFIQRKKIIE